MGTTVDLPSYVCGRAVDTADRLEVLNPFDGSRAGTVARVGGEELDAALTTALEGGPLPSRFERAQILERVCRLLEDRREDFARLIMEESGLCMRETLYETGRSLDVLQVAAAEALRDDGKVFSGDVSPLGKARKILTLREPVQMVAAITPFNHPLNQVVHKLAPAVAAGAPLILKPSEKTPLTAVKLTELFYEAGLPGWMLSALSGTIGDLVTPLIEDERVELVCFTGSVAIGKHIARTAGYKKLCLELGGNSPLIVLDDADLDEAVHLAAEGCFRNSGQRCTAVKRLLVHEKIVAPFTEKLVAKTAEYVCGDPSDPATRVGTVIDETAARRLEEVLTGAVEMGAEVLCGGKRRGAQLEPTVIGQVPRDAEMVVRESFGPFAPIMPVRDIDDAILLANSTPYGLSTGIVTNRIDAALKAVREIRTGNVNVNEIPGYRIEKSPFGGVKDSGLGIKEGVIEAMKTMTNVKTFSLPW